MTSHDQTPHPLRRGLAAALLVGVGAVSACTPGDHREQASFPFAAQQLHVTNPNANMPVSVTRGASGKVDVTVTTQTAIKSPSTPAWRLDGDALDVGSPCLKGYVGYCEGSFRIAVPDGVSVTVNGRPVVVR